MDMGMQVLSYLIAGVALYGFLGWLGDRFLGTGFLLPIGIVLGAALGCYVIIRRFGALAEPSAGPDASTALTRPTGDSEGTR
jgi:F0F1-type ATP synthase assembly protein I